VTATETSIAFFRVVRDVPGGELEPRKAGPLLARNQGKNDRSEVSPRYRARLLTRMVLIEELHVRETVQAAMLGIRGRTASTETPTPDGEAQSETHPNVNVRLTSDLGEVLYLALAPLQLLEEFLRLHEARSGNHLL
jgi:hypothetical protein